MTKRSSSLFLVLVLTAVAGQSFAQRGDSGSITGYVFDQVGNPLTGVKVTASSETQIGGKKTTYTNEEGAFRFPVLEPGKFQVRAEAPKLKTQLVETKVGINAPTEINILMEVATKVEEVQIVDKAPLVSTSTANVKEVYDIDMVDSLPHDNRDVIYSQLTNYSAGTIKGGRIRGGAGNQTIYTMDGFNMLRQFPTLKASAAYEIQTAAYGAENAMAPGGMVNLVSRSGSNKFEFQVDATGENDAMAFFKKPTDPQAGSFFYIFNPTISGPIVKDKLWYSLNAEFLAQDTGREGDIERLLPDPLTEKRRWYKGTAKLTWQVTSRNKLQSVTNFDEWWQRNRTAGLGYSKESQSTGRSQKYFTGLIWESLITDAIVFRSQAGYVWGASQFRPTSCLEDPVACMHVPGITQKLTGGLQRNQYLNNAQLDNGNETFAFQFINRLEFFINSKTLGDHNILLKNNFMTQKDVAYRSVPGDQVIEMLGTVPEATTTYYANDPRIDDARFGWFFTTTTSTRNSVSLTDAWRPTRHLTITPGVAFTYATAGNSQGGNVIEGSAFTPSITAAWDATHDGRTVVRGSFAQYVDVDVTPIASHTLGSQVQQRCLYNTTNQQFDRDCVYSGGAANTTIGLPCGPTGVDLNGQPCRKELTIPKTWEYTMGFEREVIEGLSLGVDGIYRRFNNQYEKYETNRVWLNQANALDPLGGYRNGRNAVISDLETSDDAYRRYVGVTAAVTRREGRLKLHGAYTWSRLDGTVLEGTGNRLGEVAPRDIFLEGPLGDDHRHEVKVNASIRATQWLSFGLRYSYFSGTPYSRFYLNPVTGNYEDLRARVGDSPGANLNDPADDRQLRMPDIQSINAQVIFNFKPVIGHDLETFVDVLNVLALRTPNSLSENNNDFGVVRGTEGQLRMRLGLRYRY
jgi:hypothetical protein